MAQKRLNISSTAPKVKKKKKSFTLGSPKSSPSSSPPSPANIVIITHNAPTRNNDTDEYKQIISIKQSSSNDTPPISRPQRPNYPTSKTKPSRNRNNSGTESPGSTSRSYIKVTTPTGAINTRSNNHDYRVGAYVQLNDLRQGYIRYVGQTAFSKHILYGIELDDKYQGKHSGMYKGVKYFDCASPNKGIFVTINKISQPIRTSGNGKGIGMGNLLGTMNSKQPRNKHGRKLSAMIYRNNFNKSRVSFVVPDINSLLLSPTDEDGDGDDYDDNDNTDNQSIASNDSNNNYLSATIGVSASFESLLNKYSSEMMEDINEEQEEKYSDEEMKKNDNNLSVNIESLKLTPTGKKQITNALKNQIKRIKKKTKKQKGRIGIRIPFGKLNSKCMGIILSFLTMKELSEYVFVSQSSRDSIRLVALYDFRYMLYDALSVQEIRKILCILKFHKPKELILPMAYFIYDPVVLRIFLQFFNVGIMNNNYMRNKNHLYKYIHKLVIDDRDIRPNSWLMRPGNYPWNELCNRDNEQDTVFPFELVECFQSLGENLWELDIRYTINVELSYFMKSCRSILFLSVSAENRMDMEQFYNVTHLTLQNKTKTWEEIERTELLEWKLSFKHLINLTIINQRFEASIIDLLSCISWLPSIKKYLMSNCHFNEPTQFESIEHMKKKTNLNNRLHEFIIKRHLLSKTIFTIISQFFHRINKFMIIDCKLKKSNYDFNFFKPMTHLTNITIINLKTKKRINGGINGYTSFLQSVYNKIKKYIYVCPIIIECNLIKSPVLITSHIECKYCKQLIDKTRMNDHLNIICNEVFVECPLCSGFVKRKSLSYHWLNNCKEYYIQCFLCPKLFTVKTRMDIHNHILRHSMSLDQECGKYEMVFIQNKQSVSLSNEYPIYIITICTNCKYRSIGPVVPKKYRNKLILKECDNCCNQKKDNIIDNNLKTKGRRISAMKKQRGQKVLPHPYPKNVKLKSIQKS